MKKALVQEIDLYKEYVRTEKEQLDKLLKSYSSDEKIMSVSWLNKELALEMEESKRECEYVYNVYALDLKHLRELEDKMVKSKMMMNRLHRVAALFIVAMLPMFLI